MNALCTLRISNFSVDGMGKLYRQNGGATFTMTLYLTNVKCNHVKETIELLAGFRFKSGALFYIYQVADDEFLRNYRNLLYLFT